MNLDERGHTAAADLRQAFTGTDPTGAGVELERLQQERLHRARRGRVRAGVVAALISIVAIAMLATVLRERPLAVPASPVPPGTILYGRWHQKLQQATWFTTRTDGTDVRNLGVTVTCARWWPDGSKILITNDGAFGPGHPLRPATINTDGSGLRPLDATMDPSLNLGCGDVSPDRSLIVLEGFTGDGRHAGIYTVRASDGGGLRLVTASPRGETVAFPVFSPDGTQIAFFWTRAGVNPSGAGAIFVVNLDGSKLHRITPWGGAFLDQAWSPDGAWIAYERPYGVLAIVHPDGTDRHDVPLTLPAGSGGENPTWSPDGSWIVFSLGRNNAANIYAVRPDGTGLAQITSATGVGEQSPFWTSTIVP
jgi:dipeptidyl aminopeptidase/acylaminoacyl peptidase